MQYLGSLFTPYYPKDETPIERLTLLEYTRVGHWAPRSLLVCVLKQVDLEGKWRGCWMHPVQIREKLTCTESAIVLCAV